MGVKAALAVTAALLAGLLVGLAVPESLTQQIVDLMKELVRNVFAEDPWQLALRIFLNNTRVILLMALLSPLVVVPALIVFANGVVLGVALSYAAARTSWETAILAVVPHGVFEVPALLYAAAAATSFGVAVWLKIAGRKRVTWFKLFKSLAKPLIVSLLLLALAALIEAFVTPALLHISGEPPSPQLRA